MPGLVGLICQRPPGECDSLVESMLDTMRREPFYKSGQFSCAKQGIYAGWVAHEDAFASNQVFFSEDRSVAILFSGECFPDPGVVSELRQRGHEIGDEKGAWLPHLYEEKASKFWEALNGLFSGVLVDQRNGKVFLFNDRYGTERIYWHEAADVFYFASEAKALLKVLPQVREFDHEGIAQFLSYGCTVNWRTLFRGIELLPAGSCWTFQSQTSKKVRYFDRERWQSMPSLSADSFQAKFDATFNRILPRYFETDSPLGLALTGGLDTRMILACAPSNVEKPVCYTFTGETGETFDDRVAAEVASTCGLKHHLLRLGGDFFSEFPSHADETVYVSDGCFGVTGAHEIYFNRRARQLAPVRLTGLFGSEILRGISTFKPKIPPRGLLSPELEQRSAALVGDFAAAQNHPVTSAAFANIPWNLFGSMAVNRSQLVLRSPYLDNEIVALAYEAPVALRKSSEVALRLIRNNRPALGRIPTDRRVEGRGACFPNNFKRLFREAGFKLDYYYNEGMPHWFSRFSPVLDAVDARVRIFGYHKFLHYRSWFRNRLATYVVSVLTDPRTRQNSFWNPSFLTHMANAHTQGYCNYVLAINAVLTLEAVERLLFRDFSRTPETISAEKSCAVVV